jgi:hypothetical protein
MSVETVPPHIEAAYRREEERHQHEIARLIDLYPAYRSHFCYGLLGGAVAVCDTFGVDVEAFVAELRERCPKPPVLTPPTRRQS